MAITNNEVERWFIRRGVPHFIDDYAALTDIWTRAIPVLLVAYVAGGLNALKLFGWTWQRNVLVALVVIAILAIGWAATNILRNRSWFARPREIGPPELVAFVIGPIVPSLIFTQYRDAAEALAEGLAVLAIVYLATSYGVIPLARWAARRSAAQLASLSRMVARALPLLLLFTTFLFINAEVWQVAGGLNGVAYIATVFIFFLLGSLFVLSQMPTLMSGLADFTDWAEVTTLVADTPAEPLQHPTSGPVPPMPLSRRQKVNIGLVSVFSQALQVTFVAVLLSGFFVLFGILAIPEATTAAWTQLPDVHVLASLRIDGRTLVITEPLLRVSGFLGAFTGMYFTVVLSTDSTYRDEFAEDVAPQIRQALAVRVAYGYSRRRA
jgi:hypothetical protein